MATFRGEHKTRPELHGPKCGTAPDITAKMQRFGGKLWKTPQQVACMTPFVWSVLESGRHPQGSWQCWITLLTIARVHASCFFYALFQGNSLSGPQRDAAETS